MKCSFCKILLRLHVSEEESVVHYTRPGRFQFEGCPALANRILYGIDDRAWNIVAPHIPQEKRDSVLQELLAPSALRPAPTPVIPVRDAVDYLHWIIHATIKYYKFIEWSQTCGGKVEIASVTSDRGFRWVTHKSLDWTVGDCEGQTEYSPADPHGHGR